MYIEFEEESVMINGKIYPSKEKGNDIKISQRTSNIIKKNFRFSFSEWLKLVKNFKNK